MAELFVGNVPRSANWSMSPPVSTQTVDRGASPRLPSIPCPPSSLWCHPGWCMQADSGFGRYASCASGIAAPVPPGATFIIRPRRGPSDSAQQCCAGRSFAHSSVIPGLLHPCGWPGLHSEQTAHTPWFPGSLPPRTAAHFVFVRSVELCEQTTCPSRTDSCSGAICSVLPPPESIKQRGTVRFPDQCDR